MLIEYDLLGDGEVVVTNLWVMSSICACVVLCVATFIQVDKGATQEEVKKDSE